MLKKANEYLLDTNVLEEHLIHKIVGTDSYLELLLQKGICFTTVLNASELLYKAKASHEIKIILDVLSALKILGLHSRYSLLVPRFASASHEIDSALFCVVAYYNKLPIVTLQKSKYKKSKLIIYHPKELI